MDWGSIPNPPFSRRETLGGLIAVAAGGVLTQAGDAAVQPLSRTMTDAELGALYRDVSNWGRWGKEDQRGTLNLLRSDDVRRSIATVTEGRTISLSRVFPVARSPENPLPAAHHMTTAGDLGCDPMNSCIEVAQDYIAIDIHGRTATHIDALCHIYRDGRLYNDVPASEVRSVGGARRNSIMTIKEGVAGRGVLIDVPAAIGRDFVPPETMITVAMLEAAEARQKVRVGRGDMVLVRTGRDARRKTLAEDDPAMLRLAGLDPEVARWLHVREAAVLGCDGIQDPYPFGQINRHWLNPMHICCIGAMGMHLLDNLQLEEIAVACAALHRWAFHLTLAPLPIEGGTGSPINPIALL